MIRNLSLGQRIGLGFLLIGLLVLLSSGLGLAFASSVSRTISETQIGLQQFNDLAELERSWASVAATVDRMLLTRQTGSAILSDLEILLDTYNQHLAAVSDLPGLNERDLAAAETVQLLGSQLVDSVNEITAVAQDGRWSQAQVIRHTEMSSLQRRFDESLAQFRSYIQEDVNLAVTQSVEAQNFLRLTWIGTVILAIVVGTTAGLWVMRSITRPVDALIAQTRLVTQRDFREITPLTYQDEIGELSRSFVEMTNLLRASYGELEQRVEDRTRALLISTQVSRQLTTILDRNQLVQEVVTQINTSFGYYHTHVYLFDEEKSRLLMVGGTGEAGEEMLASGHQILPGQGLVGQAATLGKPILVTDVSQSPDWLPNPLLPETQAETAVPIQIGEDVLGVIDVQHNIRAGLQQTDVDLLQSIASQVAIALQNAQLYAQAEERARRESVIRDINQKILSTTDMETAMKVAIREIGQATGAAKTRIRLQTAVPADGPTPNNGQSTEQNKHTDEQPA
ncbi:MAG: GAF domain-containing protein [Chloroflexi bacterium]|nr:GAF domain-containing protein [Chloroflexota bacterium]MBP7044896.1 GAF domain-containing protein [Chloroflexota bacterium]